MQSVGRKKRERGSSSIAYVQSQIHWNAKLAPGCLQAAEQQLQEPVGKAGRAAQPVPLLLGSGWARRDVHGRAPLNKCLLTGSRTPSSACMRWHHAVAWVYSRSHGIKIIATQVVQPISWGRKGGYTATDYPTPTHLSISSTSSLLPR